MSAAVERQPRKPISGFAMVLGYLGIFMMLIGVITALPLLFSFYPGESACFIDFLIPVAFDVIVGAVLYFCFAFRRKPGRFVRYEDSMLLMLIWILAIVSGASPFFIASLRGGMDMSFTEAMFESASGYSTTGLTIFRDYIDAADAYCPHVFAFHRSLLQFIGGVGFVLLLASLLGGNSSMTLFQTEGHNDRILANLSQTAKIIFGIYLGYTFLGTFALWFAGMPLFDALCTSMCAISGGGMSPRSTNIYYYRAFQEAYPGMAISGEVSGDIFPSPFPVHSLVIEIIVMILVIFSAISFLLHTFLLTGKWKQFFRDDEVRFALLNGIIAIVVSLAGAFATVWVNTGNPFTNWGTTTRDTVFYVVGSFTNSGFSNTGLKSMIDLGKPFFFVAVILMLIGGGAGSCAGAIKQYRMVVMFKELWHSLVYRFAPSRQLIPKTVYHYGKEKDLDQDMVSEAFNYAFLFLLIFIISNALLSFVPPWEDGLGVSAVNLETNAFNIASAMSNTGLSGFDLLGYKQYLGTVGYGGYYAYYLWVLVADMLLGRLEIMPFIYMIRNIVEETGYARAKRLAKEEAARTSELLDA